MCSSLNLVFHYYGQRASKQPMRPTLVFVYNADSGLFNTLSDIAHKLLSPQTYACNLCAITHSAFAMNKAWKEYLAGLDADLEFLHADELKSRYGITDVPLPAVFRWEDGKLEVCIDAKAVNTCKDSDDLKTLIERALKDG